MTLMRCMITYYSLKIINNIKRVKNANCIILNPFF